MDMYKILTKRYMLLLNTGATIALGSFAGTPTKTSASTCEKYRQPTSAFARKSASIPAAWQLWAVIDFGSCATRTTFSQVLMNRQGKTALTRAPPANHCFRVLDPIATGCRVCLASQFYVLLTRGSGKQRLVGGV